MLKKMAMLLGILMLVIPVSVNAATFKDGDTQYSLEEVKFEYEELENSYVVGADKDGSFVFFSWSDDKYYKVTEDDCVEMTTQEALDYFNDNTYDIVREGYDIYKVEGVEVYIEAEAFDPNQTYYYDNYSGRIVENPVEEELEDYYIRVFIKSPTNAVIDENITYYSYPTGTMVINMFKVEKPVVEDILKYRVIIEEPKKTKLATLDSTVWESVFERFEGWAWRYTYTGGEVKLSTYDYDTGYYTFNILGEEINEDLYGAYLADSLYATDIIGDRTQIFGNNGTLLHEVQGYDLYEMDYFNYISYVDGYSQGDGDNNYYKLYVYKLLSKDNQEYADKDIIVEISGQKDRIKAITVNGKALDEDNYTLSGTLTTIGLKKAYLETLAKGEYTLEVEYTDGVKVTSTFVKKASPVVDDDKETEDKNPEIEDKPATEDKKPVLDNTPTTGVADTSIIVLFVVATVVIFGLAGTAIRFKKED